MSQFLEPPDHHRFAQRDREVAEDERVSAIAAAADRVIRLRSGVVVSDEHNAVRRPAAM